MSKATWIRRAAATLMMCTSLGGCYLGRTPNAKGVAYVANGAFAVAGLALIANDHPGDEQGIGTAFGVVPLLVGLTGLAINLATATEHPAPVEPAKPVRSGESALVFSGSQR